ncbi:LOW QUALITY PROTEIN: hypothetical protein U0070_014756, partial [Myodes glareolus]
AVTWLWEPAGQISGQERHEGAGCMPDGEGAEEDKTSDRLETVILDVTKTESIVAVTQWVKERVVNRGTFEIPVCVCWFDSVFEGPLGILPGPLGLVNNAGLSILSSLNEWMKKEDFAKILDVNCLG